MDISVAGGQIAPRGQGSALGWGMASKPKIRGQVSGDGYLIRWISDRLLAAVVDGAGSGREAAAAANACLAVLADAIPPDLAAIFAACDSALGGTRGAALGLALIDPARARLDWAAIGDIDALLLQPVPDGQPRRHAIIKRGGTLGSTPARPLVQAHGLGPGDLLVLVTDGIARGFGGRIAPDAALREIAHDLVRNAAGPADDSLALVLRLEDQP
ncbi:SpoIIE family protein phosphatase [Poseidonocella sp. HB161398]|uniref:SpoIIE family protein phosphatase n=1 Tax=Poseidonocella sp. HB161398 TaxID=2320855 RepID=UPI001108410F|nr:SpoIIE family protein phosphatase [Poseidonocella sp. HB161398]